MNAVVSASFYHDDEHSGPWCNDHRSQYCEHVIQYIKRREDAKDLRRVILMEESPAGQPLNDGTVFLTVPIYPTYSVWEHLMYDVRQLEPFGPVGIMSEEEIGGSRSKRGIQRLMPGESANDIAMTLRQEFEDDLEEYHHKLVVEKTFPWKCRSHTHSFKYQRVLEQVVTPRNVEEAFRGAGDVEMIFGMLYGFLRYKRCLFCYVNERNRDALRVNPAMSGFMGGNVTSEPTNFEDLVPN